MNVPVKHESTAERVDKQFLLWIWYTESRYNSAYMRNK